MSDERPVAPPSGSGGTDLRVLFVEDSPDDMELFLHRLRQAGYAPNAHRVDSSSGLREALSTDGWQVAIVDYVIPGFSGRDALAMLGELAPDLPTIVASGHAPEEVVAETARLGAVDYLLKDDLTRVVPAVEHAVRERRQRLGRRESDRRLRERERTLSTLFANLPGMVYRCAADGNWTMRFVSDGIREVLDYQPADILPGGSVTWNGLIHEDDRDYVRTTTMAAVAERRDYTLQYRMWAGDGTLRWVWERGRAVYGDDGAAQALEGFMLDVTERRRAELDLQAARDRLERLLTATNAVIYSSGLEPPWPNTFLGANVYDVLGYTTDEWLGDDSFWLSHVHPDDSAIADGLTEQTVTTAHGVAEYRFRAADGSYRWLHDEQQLSRGSAHEATELAGQFWDVTDRRRAEEELRESERRLELRSRVAEAFLTESGETVFQAALHIVLEVVACPCGLFCYLDGDGDLVVPPQSPEVVAACGLPEGPLRLARADWGDEFWATALRTRSTEVVAGDAYLPGTDRSFERAVAAPIAYGERALGVLTVAGKDEGFSEGDLTALEEVASYAAPILQEWLTRTSFEEALLESQQQLALRNEVADALLSTPDTEMFGRILEIVQTTLESPLGMFGHLDANGDLVTPRLVEGVWDADRPECSEAVLPRAHWESSIWGAALRTGKSQRQDGLEPTPDGHTDIDCALSVPLTHAGEVLGVITVANRPGGYDDEDMATLESIASYVAPVLQARLRRSAAEEETARSAERLRRTVDGVVAAMGTLVDMRDPYTAGHERRVASLAVEIAREMAFDESDVSTVRLAGQVHDVGKMAIPAEILSRPGRLQPTELSIIRTHPQVGFDILSAVDFDAPIAELVLQHHERMDGSGYPRGLDGDQILPLARVLAVADVVEAMSSHRPYRPALGLDVAVAEVESNAGTLYDADVVAACLAIVGRSDFSFD